MQIAIVLYDRLTALDAIGPYQVLGLMPGAEVVFVGERAGPVRNDISSLGLIADAGFAEVPSPDIVVVPGALDPPLSDGPLREWLGAVDATTTWTTSVCTGSLILAAAGLLTGRTATTHWTAYDELTRLGATPTSNRVVFDGKYVTAAGVSAGIDMGLTLAGKIAGDDVARAIQLVIEYDPQPPYDAGSPDKAPEEIVASVRGMLTAARSGVAS
jgi:transcriptional regulator GlxA family with amidase domain